MTNYRQRATGVEPDREVNYTEEYKCEHCGHWVEEAEENGDDYICLECLKEFTKCGCGRYEITDDMTDGLCYECWRNRELEAIEKWLGWIRDEYIRSEFKLTDELHKYSLMLHSLVFLERRKNGKR